MSDLLQGQQFDTGWQIKERQDREAFTKGCGFAQVVSTTDGPALLVAGTVIKITSPDRRHAEWLAAALRRSREGAQG